MTSPDLMHTIIWCALIIGVSAAVIVGFIKDRW